MGVIGWWFVCLTCEFIFRRFAAPGFCKAEKVTADYTIFLLGARTR